MGANSVPETLLPPATPGRLQTNDPGRRADTLEPGSGPLVRVFVGLALCIAIFALLAAFLGRRRARQQRSRQVLKLETYLQQRSVLPSERALLFEIVRQVEEPPERVARLVLSFDRAVDLYLASHTTASEEARLQLLRRLKCLRSKLELDRVAPGVPILSTRELGPGLEVVCRLADAPGSKVLPAHVIDCDDAGLVLELDLPAEARSSAEVQPAAGRELDVYFLRPGEGGYRFRTRVMAVPVDCPGGKVLWVLAHPRKVSREQRRHYLRVPVHERVAFALVPNAPGGPDTPLSIDQVVLGCQGVLLDVSGGGARLLVERISVQPEDQIVLELPFLEPPHTGLRVAARVTKVHRPQAELGLLFEDLSPEAGAALLRHVERVHRSFREPTPA